MLNLRVPTVERSNRSSGIGNNRVPSLVQRFDCRRSSLVDTRRQGWSNPLAATPLGGINNKQPDQPFFLIAWATYCRTVR